MARIRGGAKAGTRGEERRSDTEGAHGTTQFLSKAVERSSRGCEKTQSFTRAARAIM